MCDVMKVEENGRSRRTKKKERRRKIVLLFEKNSFNKNQHTTAHGNCWYIIVYSSEFMIGGTPSSHHNITAPGADENFKF
jgi:hypothetical protein